VVGRKMLPDSKSMLRRAAKEALALMPVDAVIVTGGTGLSPTDITIESLATVITKQIPGFGELFRRLSFDRIGSAAMMSRAIAGLVEKKVIFCLPGSPDAVQMAMQQLILPELGHVIRVARQG
jgi:molybdenum cofactor biosynthesis protein B